MAYVLKPFLFNMTAKLVYSEQVPNNLQLKITSVKKSAFATAFKTVYLYENYCHVGMLVVRFYLYIYVMHFC